MVVIVDGELLQDNDPRAIEFRRNQGMAQPAGVSNAPQNSPPQNPNQGARPYQSYGNSNRAYDNYGSSNNNNNNNRANNNAGYNNYQNRNYPFHTR